MRRLVALGGVLVEAEARYYEVEGIWGIKWSHDR